MKNILLVESNQELSLELQRVLSRHHYRVFCTELGRKAVEILSAGNIDLCVLDADLPEGSGVDLCRSIRCIFREPIILLSAYGEEKDIIQGLKCGADDYVTKPFSINILICRIGCQLRRVEWERLHRREKVCCLYTGNLMIDLDHQMVFRNGAEVELRHTEFLLCSNLASGKGMILTRRLLLAKIWEERDRMVEDSTLTVHICRLRKKLGRYQGKSYICTVRGIGYRWNVKIC